MCLKAVFQADGDVKANIKNEQVRQPLTDLSLMFVSIIHIHQRHQRQGLLWHVLQNFYTLLTRLPEWYAFHGAVVLVPGAPKARADGGLSWGHMSGAAIEKSLRKTYANQGFAAWIKNAKVEKTVITVMGRVTPAGGGLV